jgi:RimJ/RimL family protein N-acetyltransferase
VDTPALTDGVVTLTGHTLADVGAQLAGEDEEHARRFGWYPYRSTTTSVRAAIRRWRREWREQGVCRAFAVRDAETGALAGGCELRFRSAESAEASYWIFPAYRGRGWAARALKLAVPWAADAGVRRFVVEIEPDNAASARVALRAGFVPAGERLNEQGRRMMVLRRDLDHDSVDPTSGSWSDHA